VRANSQNSTLDSLNHLYKNSKYDTTKIRLKINIAENIYLQNPDSALKIFESVENECQIKLKNKGNSNADTKALKNFTPIQKQILVFYYVKFREQTRLKQKFLKV